jgi:hypothetical protein
MTEVRISSLCERPCAGIEETGEAPSDAGGMECSRRRKVHSLIDKVYDPANLAEAWKRVRENKGSAGIDGLTVAGFEQRQDELLDTLHKQLREKTYRPSPVKRVAIPKLGGGTRNLGIPSVRDRVVQQALVQKMNPIFEPLFCGLLVWLSTRPIATYGDAEGVAGNPRGQLLDFRCRLAHLL